MVLVDPHQNVGQTTLESLACGTPVVTSNRSASAEVAGDAAILVNPMDAQEIAGGILKILTDPRLREDLRQRGLERAKSYSWKKAALETLDVYKKALDVA